MSMWKRLAGSRWWPLKLSSIDDSPWEGTVEKQLLEIGGWQGDRETASKDPATYASPTEGQERQMHNIVTDNVFILVFISDDWVGVVVALLFVLILRS
jgi:hypothetical protein